MTGDVDDAGLHASGECQGRKAEIDGDAAPLLFFPPIGVDAGERLYQCGFAVIDVPGRADYEPLVLAGNHARRSQMSIALAFSGLPLPALWISPR